MVRIRSFCAAVLAGFALCSWAADIKVMASTGVSAMFQQLLPVFERNTGHKVLISYDTSNIIIRKINAGDTADLVVLTAPLIDQLAQQGRVVPGSRVDLARSGIGVAIRAGAPRPDISSVEAFKQFLLQAKSVTYT
ncbi:MAG: ABC transporter substrate-binding protein, partial [Betaproteobacteria bacterium]|nr:ABC transporter substrate-binding protein [Betaproteobacteria bacterium]